MTFSPSKRQGFLQRGLEFGILKSAFEFWARSTNQCWDQNPRIPPGWPNPFSRVSQWLPVQPVLHPPVGDWVPLKAAGENPKMG